jgi:succinate dehydrogenase/fumarate reductase flavoprotein subunit
MQTDCAVFRTKETLAQGKTAIDDVWNDSDDVGVSDRSLIWNSDLVETLEYDNLIAQAAVTVNGALAREESRGGHARNDFTTRDDEKWLKHTIITQDKDGNPKLSYKDVDISKWKPVERKY